MAYKIDDLCFQNELWINAYNNQLNGYRFGDSARINFQPIMPIIGTSDGSDIDRKQTIEVPVYTFTPEQKVLLLEEL